MNEEVYHIDLEELKEGVLNEGAYTQFGSVVKMWIQTLLGGRPFHTAPKFKLSGSRGDMKAFMSALGLDDPRTFMNKSKFQTALRKFERQTGITWPVR